MPWTCFAYAHCSLANLFSILVGIFFSNIFLGKKYITCYFGTVYLGKNAEEAKTNGGVTNRIFSKATVRERETISNQFEVIAFHKAAHHHSSGGMISRR